MPIMGTGAGGDGGLTVDPETPSSPGGIVGDGTDQDQGAIPDPLYAVVFERWRTAGDERTCPICWPLDWVVFEQGTGPYPGLHWNCRCWREYAYTEWQSRPPEVWG